MTPLTPSTLFWMDIIAHVYTAIVASALLMLVMGTDARRPLNRGLAAWMAATLVWIVGSFALRMSLLLEAGKSLFWIELAIAGFGFIGPALFLFSVRYVQSDQTWHETLARTGLLAAVAVLPLLFSHQIVHQVNLDSTDLLQWQMTPLGPLALSLPFAFETFTLILFWHHRQKIGEPILVISATFLLMGGIVGTMVRLPMPTLSLTTAASISVLGYAVVRRQLFSPLQRLTQELESQVDERTREIQQEKNRLERLSEQQRIAADIGHHISQIYDPDEKLKRLVELVHNRLGYHHVYIYRPTETTSELIPARYLEICAAAGTTARTVLVSSRRLRMGGDTLAGQVAIQRRARSIEDSGADAIYFTRTVLPGARAEMAVPLVVRDRLLAVLDLQSIHPGAFSNQDLIVLEILTNQVAVDLDNARLLQETRALMEEMEKSQQQYLAQAWQSAATISEHAPAFVYTAGRAIEPTSLDQAWSPEIAQAVDSDQPVVVQDANPPAFGITGPLEGNSPVVAIPIRLRGQIIGAFELRRKPGTVWQPDQIDTLNEFGERLGLALETARLADETQRRAARERFVREITSQMHESMDLNAILRTTVQQLGQALNADEIAVRIMPSEAQAHSPNNSGASR